jgi:glycosyltransferase involved in cell wall biosynthesis
MFGEIDLVITLFNKEKYISRAIDSALLQYKKQFNKIIVVNDGSTDQSKKVIEDKYKNNSKIKLVNIKNSGVSVARNIGTKYSEAKYIVFLDADDELNEHYLFEINKLIDFYPDCKIYSTIHRNIYDTKNKDNTIILYHKNNLNISTNSIKEFFFNFNIICSSGICVLKEEIEKFQFPENISIGEDIYVWLKLFSVNKIAWSSRELINIYKDSSDRTQNTRFNQIPYYLIKKKEIIDLYKNKFWINIYFILSFFINYFKLKNNKKVFQHMQILRREYKYNDLVIKVIPNFISFFIYYLFSKIRHDLKKFFFLIGAIFSPNIPLIFLIIYILDDKSSATQFLIIQFYLVFLISLVSFFAKFVLFRKYSNVFFFRNISFRIISIPFIFICAFIFNIFLKFNISNLFFYFFYIILLWLVEIQIIFLINRKLYLKYLLLILCIILSNIFLLYSLIKQIDYYYIFPLLILIVYILINKKLFYFSFRKYKIISYIFYKNFSYRNIFISNLFNNINIFFFRYLFSISFVAAFVSDFFFFLFLITLPVSFLNNAYSEYIANIDRNEKIFSVISILFIVIISLFFLLNNDKNYLDKNIIFFNSLSAIIFVVINVIRSRMFGSEIMFVKLSILDKRSSILFASMLLFAFFQKDILVYIYFINSILQIFIFRKLLKNKL